MTSQGINQAAEGSQGPRRAAQGTLPLVWAPGKTHLDAQVGVDGGVAAVPVKFLFSR